MSFRRRNIAHLVNALADRRMLDNRLIASGHLKTIADRREMEKIELRIDTELSHLGLSRFDTDDFEDDVRAEVLRRRHVQRQNKRTIAYDFSADLRAIGLMGAR